jgi:hypothetical protein
MSKEIHKKSYDAAIQELSDLMEVHEDLENQLSKVESQIYRVKSAVMGVAGLCGAQPDIEYPHLFPERLTNEDIGFTDAIREVLQEDPGGRYFSPIYMRDALKMNGFNITKYKNPLASIHTILKRLQTRGEARTKVMDGKVWYTGVRK